MRVLVKFDNSAKPQPIAGPLATSGKKDNYTTDISLLLDKYGLKIKYPDTQADPKV